MYFNTPLTDGEGVPNGPHDGKHEDGTQVVEEESVGHEVASIEDDWGQHVDEEDVGREGRDGGRVGVEEEEANHHPQHDEHARLGEHLRQAGSHVET